MLSARWFTARSTTRWRISPRHPSILDFCRDPFSGPGAPPQADHLWLLGLPAHDVISAFRAIGPTRSASRKRPTLLARTPCDPNIHGPWVIYFSPRDRGRIHSLPLQPPHHLTLTGLCVRHDPTKPACCLTGPLDHSSPTTPGLLGAASCDKAPCVSFPAKPRGPLECGVGRKAVASGRGRSQAASGPTASRWWPTASPWLSADSRRGAWRVSRCP